MTPSTQNVTNPMPNADDPVPAPSVQPAQAQQTPPPAAPAPAQQPKQPDLSKVPAGTVGNAPSPAPQTPTPPPAVQRAGWVRQIAETLAGGPRYQVSIDPSTGQTTRTPVPVSGRHLGLAIALEALSGGLEGLGQTGPNATGRAAAAGVKEGISTQQTAQANQEAAAQQQYENESQAMSRKANLADLNTRLIATAEQSERLGLDNMQSVINANADRLQDFADEGVVEGRGIDQDSLLAGMATGQYNVTQQTAIPDGYIVDPVTGKPEFTFSIVANPHTQLSMPSDESRGFGDDRVPGFAAFAGPDGNVPSSMRVPGTIRLRAGNEQVAIKNTAYELNGIASTLKQAGDPLAADVPDMNQLVAGKDGHLVANSLLRLQKYLGYSGTHQRTLAESLALMAQPTRPSVVDPNKQVPNADAPFARDLIGLLGGNDYQRGLAVLNAYQKATAPDPIKNEADAESILTDSMSTPREKAHAQAFLNAAAKQKQKEAQGRAAENGNGTLNVGQLTPKEYQTIIDGIGTNTLDASQMLRYGKADQLKILADVKAKYPNFDATQYQANLKMAQWATSGKGGDQIQALNTLHAHAQDFLDNINQLSNLGPALLNTPINKLKAWSGDPNVPDTVARMLAVRTEYMNALNNNHALTAEDKADAKQLLNLNQSPAQWRAVVQQIQHTANLRGAQTNQRYRAVFGKDMPNYHAPAGSAPQKFQYMTSDGKLGWNGSAWVPTGK